jgi:small subunit ribosomal protein S1
MSETKAKQAEEQAQKPEQNGTQSADEKKVKTAAKKTETAEKKPTKKTTSASKKEEKTEVSEKETKAKEEKATGTKAEETTEKKTVKKTAQKKEPVKATAKAAKKESDDEKEKKPIAAAKKTEVKAEEDTEKKEVKEEEVEKTSKEELEVTAGTETKEEKKEAKKAPAKAEKAEGTSTGPDTDFDWDGYANSNEIYTSHEKDDYVKMYDETLSTVAENEVVEGTVISLNKREVVINIGYKSEGVVSLNEFRYNPNLKPGDKVEVFVESQEDKKGQLVLSHKKARALKSWDRVNEALERDEVITGYIKCRTKGGMIVDVFGIEAFLPGSQIDVKPIRDYDIYVGKNMEFKVVKINQEFKNVVVSHKALIEAELEQQKKDIIAKLEKGQILEGTVKNITSYGVFIDLGGVDGLIHITDLSWGRVNHPEEIVQLDQKLQVVILDFDDDKKRIALGLKQLTPHPWDSLDEKLKVGDVVKGKVVVMADYGAFVEIAPGVEGLIHVSEMSWSQHLRSAQEFLNVGDEVEAQILTLDREERKMSLGMKQLKQDPWDKIDEKYALNSKHTAKVRNFTNFGVFVEIEEGVDGLIHISDLSWTKKIKHPAEFTNIGDDIEVVVLEIDKENRRLSLGHKQLEENPWDVFETIFTIGSVHEGTITEIVDKGALVALPYGVEGFVTPRHLVKEDGTAARVDEKLPFKVVEFSKSAKKIVLSHTRVFEDDKKAAVHADKKSTASATKRATKKIKANLEKTTLGDVTDLAALKKEMENAEKDKKEKASDSNEK